MTLYDVWQRAEKEIKSSPELQHNFLRRNGFFLSEKWPYLYVVAQKYPYLIKFINYASKHPLTPRLLQAYLNGKTGLNWHMAATYSKGAPKIEYLLAQKACEGKQTGKNAYDNLKQFLNDTTTINISFGCTLDKNTKMEYSIQSILMKPKAPVNALESDNNFNLYQWVIGGPVIGGKNIWANCPNGQSALVIKAAICEHMKHVIFVPTKEDTHEK